VADRQGDQESRDDALRDAAAADAPAATEAPDDDAVPRTRPRAQTDRFENARSGRRVGAHRVTARPRRVWYYLLAAIVGIAVLTGAGVLAVQAIGSSVTDFINPPDEEPTVEPVKPELDPDATVAVLNGTPDDGLGLAVADAISTNKWGKIGFSEVAANREVQISAVFYTSVADEAMALGLAQELGGVSTYQSYDYTKYGMQLVVLLGTDYAGPGSEKADAE